MLIQLKTDFMRYETGDLRLDGDNLLLCAGSWEKSFPISALSAVSLIKNKRGARRLELDIGEMHVEAIIPQESERSLTALLTAITRRKGRVDLRMDL